MDLLAQNAVDEAIKGNWKEAIKINEGILNKDSKNREALNRLARAYLELGKINKAVAAYKKVLKIDPYNNIAQKALTRLKNIKEMPQKMKNGINESNPMATPDLFIEEPGKTKAVSLIHFGSPGTIASLDAGQPIKLSPHLHRVSAVTLDGQYIGRLSDDLASRLIRLIKKGNEYSAFIRSVSSDSVRIFIRETKRSVELKDTPSFPSTDKPGYVSFTSPDTIHDERPDVSTVEEEDSEA